MLRRLFISGLLTACARSALAADANEVVVVVHKDNPNEIDLALVQRVFLGQVRVWPDGNGVQAFDQPEASTAREQFCTRLLKRSVSTVKAVWAQNIFTGRGYPPKLLPDDAQVRQAVQMNRHAIGYLRRGAVEGGLRIVES